MTDTLFLADFRRACLSSHCPFCTLAVEATKRYLASLLRESTLAPQIHQRLARSRGLCRSHAWLLKDVEQAAEGDGHGTATLYSTVVQSLRADLEASLAEPPSRAPRAGRWSARRTLFAGRLGQRLRREGDCLVCEHLTHTQTFALAQLIESLAEVGAEGELASLYHSSAGACLPHFLRLLERAPDESGARWLAQEQLHQVRELEAQLEHYRRTALQDRPRGVEAESWARALAQTAGIPEAFGD